MRLTKSQIGIVEEALRVFTKDGENADVDELVNAFSDANSVELECSDQRKNEVWAKAWSSRLTIDISDVLRSLPPAVLQELAEALAWEPYMLAEIKHGLKDEFATPNYNSTIFELRQAVLESDSAIRDHVQALLGEIQGARDEARAYSNAYHQMYHWLRDRAWRDPMPGVEFGEHNMPSMKEVDEWIAQHGLPLPSQKS